jgi:para-nitrobenzyl esterase
MCMLATGGAGRLFHRAILQSPPAGMLPLSSAASAANGRQLAELLGIADGSDEARLARLRAAPVPDMLEAQHKLLRATARFADLAPPFLPVVDGFASHDAFLTAVAAGAGADGVDLIIGTTRDEAHAFFRDPTIQLPPLKPELVAERFAALAGDAGGIEAYRRRHPGASVSELVSALVTDHTFLFPAIRLAEAATHAGARAWLYQFDWAPPVTPLKACHCIELPFVFGNLPAWSGAPMMAGADPEAFAALSAAVRGAWSEFTHGRDPAPGMPWPSYEPARRQTFCFGAVSGPFGDPAGVAWRRRAAA